MVLISANFFNIFSESSIKPHSLFGCFGELKIALEAADECCEVRIKDTKAFERVSLFKRGIAAGGFEEESSIFAGEKRVEDEICLNSQRSTVYSMRKSIC